ncbi:hypothetical protein KK120_08940 [Virgibacillus dakarensis]|nr:hypothetical protein [Virgibacillus dakarensis]MBT2215948.1 hypothetical protein [Virgibacillus dakarensis]
MKQEEITALYERVMDLPEHRQSSVLAGVIGSLKYFAEKGDRTAIQVLETIESSVEQEEAWEQRRKEGE